MLVIDEFAEFRVSFEIRYIDKHTVTTKAKFSFSLDMDMLAL